MHTYVAVNEWRCFLCFIKELSPRYITKQKKSKMLISGLYYANLDAGKKERSIYICIIYVFMT